MAAQLTSSVNVIEWVMPAAVPIAVTEYDPGAAEEGTASVTIVRVRAPIVDFPAVIVNGVHFIQYSSSISEQCQLSAGNSPGACTREMRDFTASEKQRRIDFSGVGNIQ